MSAWPRASSWLQGGGSSAGTVALGVVGAPLHEASISPSRADLAPAAIRGALHRLSVYDFATGTDLRSLGVEDRGDLDLARSTPEVAFEPLRDAISGFVDNDVVAVVLGGDNSVTRPAVHALGDLEAVGLVTLDAHLDLRETTDGLSNGNPVRALLEDGLPGPNVVQIGIQSFANSPDHADVARKAGIKVVPRDEVAARTIRTVVAEALEHLNERVGAIYVDFDVDVLDRAFAPATPGARPGGIAPRELFEAAFLCGRHPKVKAADIVEVSPPDDVADVTVLAAAQLLLRFASGVVTRG